MKQSTHYSLTEYLIHDEGLNEIPIKMASKILKEAEKHPDKRTRRQRRLSTPLLTPSDWKPIYTKHKNAKS